MKRVAIIACIILAALVGGALITAYAAVGTPGDLATAASSIPQPPASRSSSAPKQELKITDSSAPTGEDTGEAEDAAAYTQPPPVAYEGGTSPAGNASALEGAWQYYETADAQNGQPVMVYQYRFYNESGTLNLSYGILNATINANMLGSYGIGGDGTVVLGDITWSTEENPLGHVGGNAVLSLGWPADGSEGLVVTLVSYETGTGERFAPFDHILGVPLLCTKFGEAEVVQSDW